MPPDDFDPDLNLDPDLPVDGLPADPPADESDDDRRLRAAAEEEASRKGWVPKHKFKKDPAMWVDASEFLARGKQHNSALQQQVADLTSKLKAFEGTQKKFIEYYDDVVKQKDQELEAAIRQLRVQRSEAQAEGDHQASVEIEDRIDTLQQQRKELKAEAAAAQKPATPASETPDAAGTTDPVLEAWISEGNQWFQTDTKLRNYAVALGQELIDQGETLRGREFLDKVASLMAAEFPSKFGNSRRERAGSAESGRGTSSGSGGKSERDLPKADRELMEEFVANGWTTKEKFLKDYWSRNG